MYLPRCAFFDPSPSYPHQIYEPGHLRKSWSIGYPECSHSLVASCQLVVALFLAIGGSTDPRWQIAGQHPPGTTTLQEIENAVQDLTPAMFSSTTRFRFGWQIWSDFQPLRIIQVRWVNLSRFGHPTSFQSLS